MSETAVSYTHLDVYKRQQYGWLLGRVAGIPVYIGRSWPIIAVVVVMTFGPQLAGALPGGAGYAVAAAYALLLFCLLYTSRCV